MKYAQHFSTKQTPQTEKAHKKQVKNNAGGFVFELDKWGKLERFLILGTEGGSYYTSERQLTRDNCNSLLSCLEENGVKTVNTIVQISESGRAAKNDAAIFALAIASADPEYKTRKAALSSIPKVCRTATHLFQYMESVKNFRGTGSGFRRHAAKWYEEKSLKDLQYQLVKYRSRNNWTHKDVLKLIHLKPSEIRNPVYRFVSGLDTNERTVYKNHKEWIYPPTESFSDYLLAFDELQKTDNKKRVVELINQYKFTHEMLPSNWKNDPKIWTALLPDMPVRALVRNLNKLTNLNVINSLSDELKFVTEKITNEKVLKNARMHPIDMLYAMKTYGSGRGFKGSLTWKPLPQVVDALNDAFYLTFNTIEPSNKSIMLCLDVSGSMDYSCSGMKNLSCREASAAMAMATARVEKNYAIMAFGHRFAEVKISPRQRLDDVIRQISHLPFMGTDCALPMVYAKDNQLKVDCFQVYTDCETWYGRIHPHQALNEYRQKSGRHAKSVVVGMVANEFSIANPDDGGMMDVVGFDTQAPAVMADFVRG